MATVNSLLYILLTLPPTPNESVTTEINQYGWKNEDTTIISQSYLDPITERPEISAALQRVKCKSNETYSRCDYLCQKNCDNYDKPFPCPKVCVWGCICKEGFVRGPNKNCIKIEDCGSKPEQKEIRRKIDSPVDRKKCPTNEIWDNCYAHCQKNCSHFNDDIPCTGKCTPGCVCSIGYVRGPNGKCILPYECNKKSESNQGPSSVYLDCNDKEYLDLCPSSCPIDCNNFRGNRKKCFPFLCIPGCVCHDKFVRGPNGKCIEPHECPKEKYFCPEGEVYSPCESHCEGNCVNKGKDVKCIKNSLICVSGCKCKKGLVRGPDGNCIYPNECPSNPKPENPVRKCPSHEEYKECSAGCQQNCTNVDSPIPCPDECLSGCVCKENFIRGMSGKCVNPTECPKTDAPGEIYESSEIQTEVSTLRSDVSEKMDENPVKEDQLPICGANENYVRCPCSADCNNYKDKNRKCNTILCIPGCECKEGFVLGPNNKCIKKEQCPGNRNCPAGELYSKCNANCQKNCSNWAYDLICPKKCVEGCICKPGLIRGPDRKCTYWFKCPHKSSPSEEDYLSLPASNGCPNDMACTEACRDFGFTNGQCVGENGDVCTCSSETFKNSWKKEPLSADTCDQEACVKKCTEEGYALAICRYNQCHCKIIQ